MSGSEDVVPLYQAHAAAFGDLRDQSLFERGWLTAFLDQLPKPAPRVIDIGSGTGRPISAWLAGEGCRITGIDAAEAMTGLAREALPGQDWITADMRRLPPIGRFHGIVAWHSLFHLTPDDQRAMFPRFARLTDDVAALLFTSGSEYGESTGSLAGRPLYHASLSAPEYRELLNRNGFAVMRHAERDLGCGGATVWLARRSGDVR